MLTTSSWETMLTEENNHSRLCASSWPTRSSTQRTSSCWEEITSVPPLTESTGSMMSAREDTTSSCGKLLLTALTAYPLLPLSMRRSSACTVVSAQNWVASSKSRELWGLPMFLIRDCCVISFGQIPTKMYRAGEKTTEVWVSHSDKKLCQHSTRSTTLTSFVELTRWWRTAMSSLPSGS